MQPAPALDALDTMHLIWRNLSCWQAEKSGSAKKVDWPDWQKEKQSTQKRVKSSSILTHQYFFIKRTTNRPEGPLFAWQHLKSVLDGERQSKRKTTNWGHICPGLGMHLIWRNLSKSCWQAERAIRQRQRRIGQIGRGRSKARKKEFKSSRASLMHQYLIKRTCWTNKEGPEGPLYAWQHLKSVLEGWWYVWWRDKARERQPQLGLHKLVACGTQNSCCHCCRREARTR